MAKIENKNVYVIGDKVWWLDAWNNLRWGIIYDFKEGYAAIHEDGKKGIQTGAKLEDCWPTREACIHAEAERSKLQTEEYKESIKSVEDLVKFLWENDVNSEYRDYDAAKAARIRAKELLNIELN